MLSQTFQLQKYAGVWGLNDLEDLRITGMIRYRSIWHGIDSPDACEDPDHFRQYPHTVSYRYNSRGFRDQEWPDDLATAVWCLGDSFTVGLGSPVSHTWPQQLALLSQRRVINISMNGASNQWIHRRALQIIDAVQPTNMVIMWSYLHRREDANTELTDEERRIYNEPSTDQQDLQMLCDQINELNATGTNILHTAVPFFAPHEMIVPPELNILTVEKLDLARDGLHFDIKTGQWLAQQLTPRLV